MDEFEYGELVKIVITDLHNNVIRADYAFCEEKMPVQNFHIHHPNPEAYFIKLLGENDKFRLGRNFEYTKNLQKTTALEKLIYG